jgi:hypothetical protein
VVHSPPNFNANNALFANLPFHGVRWSGMLAVIVLVALLMAIVRRGMLPAMGHGLRRGSRAVVVILLIACWILSTVRVEYTVSQASNATQQPLGKSDISAEIDQFDAPRIQLPPTAPAAPTQPTAAATSNSKAIAAISKAEAAKTAATATHKRKKSDIPPAGTDKKQVHLIAQTSPEAKATPKKDDKDTREKQAMVAEAEPDKPTQRPAWVDEGTKRTGNALREVIATDLYESDYECSLAADVYLLLKTYERMQQLTGKLYSDGPLPSVTFRKGQVTADGELVAYVNGNPYWIDPRISSLASMGIDAEYVKREIVAKDSKNGNQRVYTETVERSFGPMKKLYRQIEFTSSVDNDLRRHWDASERRERFGIAGVGAGSILGFIGLIFGLLKIDTWTKGYYSKRLFIGVPAAIIAGLLLVSLLVGRPTRSESGPTVPLPHGYSN